MVKSELWGGAGMHVNAGEGRSWGCIPKLISRPPPDTVTEATAFRGGVTEKIETLQLTALASHEALCEKHVQTNKDGQVGGLGRRRHARQRRRKQILGLYPETNFSSTS
jgi:hypothetical protein